MLRMVLPKKTNFEFLTQWDLRTIDREFGATLYLEEPHQSNENISWNWLLNEFAEQPFYTFKSPKAVLLIEEISKNIENNYAVTFGSSYFKIDKFCNRDYGFSFASRIEYTNVKTTTLTSPNLTRNNTVKTSKTTFFPCMGRSCTSL